MKNQAKKPFRLAPDLEAAILFFAQEQGSRWKSDLRDSWNNGVYPYATRDNDVDAELQTWRNRGGTMQLKKVTKKLLAIWQVDSDARMVVLKAEVKAALARDSFKS